MELSDIPMECLNSPSTSYETALSPSALPSESMETESQPGSPSESIPESFSLEGPSTSEYRVPLSQRYVNFKNPGKENPWINTGTKDIKVYYPTMKEMTNFTDFIKQIEEDKAHLASGICKVVPPFEWHERYQQLMLYGKRLAQLRIKKALQVNINPIKKSDRVYVQNNDSIFYDNAITAEQYANECRFGEEIENCPSVAEYEKNFWQNLNESTKKGVYAADVESSLFSKKVDVWNINNLGTLFNKVTVNENIPGVTSPYLYFGAEDTTFSWHVEDVDFYSINYHHFGEPKFWNAIPSSHAEQFERLCHQLYQGEFEGKCKTYIRHKICIIHPDILKQHGIPFGNIPQYPGEFIITFPKGYHMGYNMGFNCNEAINFASERWFGYGLTAKMCNCNPDFAVRLHIPNIYCKQNNALLPPEAPKVPHLNPAELQHPVRSKIQFELILKQMKDIDVFSGSFESEIKWNKEKALQYPYCAVCQYFVPKQKSISAEKRPSMSIQIVNPFEQKMMKPKLNPVRSPLLTCIDCFITVHEKCVQKEPTKKISRWRCPPCARYFNNLEVRSKLCCQWCCMRGGLLIPFHKIGFALQASTSYVHIICALMNRLSFIYGTNTPAAALFNPCKECPNGQFWDGYKLQENDCTDALKAYVKHEPELFYGSADENHCGLCGEGLADGCIAKCFQCYKNGENSGVYHVTCARLMGFQWMKVYGFEYAVAQCPQHNRETSSRQHLEPLKVGDTVFYPNASSKDNHFTIYAVSPKKQYTVQLYSGETVEVLHNEINNCQCRELKCGVRHKQGFAVRIDESWGIIVATDHPYTYSCMSANKNSEDIVTDVERQQLFNTYEWKKLNHDNYDDSDDAYDEEEDRKHKESSDDDYSESEGPKKKKNKMVKKFKTENNNKPVSYSVLSAPSGPAKPTERASYSALNTPAGPAKPTELASYSVLNTPAKPAEPASYSVLSTTAGPAKPTELDSLPEPSHSGATGLARLNALAVPGKPSDMANLPGPIRPAGLPGPSRPAGLPGPCHSRPKPRVQLVVLTGQNKPSLVLKPACYVKQPVLYSLPVPTKPSGLANLPGPSHVHFRGMPKLNAMVGSSKSFETPKLASYVKQSGLNRPGPSKPSVPSKSTKPVIPKILAEMGKLLGQKKVDSKKANEILNMSLMQILQLCLKSEVVAALKRNKTSPEVHIKRAVAEWRSNSPKNIPHSINEGKFMEVMVAYGIDVKRFIDFIAPFRKACEKKVDSEKDSVEKEKKDSEDKVAKGSEKIGKEDAEDTLKKGSEGNVKKSPVAKAKQVPKDKNFPRHLFTESKILCEKLTLPIRKRQRSQECDEHAASQNQHVDDQQIEQGSRNGSFESQKSPHKPTETLDNLSRHLADAEILIRKEDREKALFSDCRKHQPSFSGDTPIRYPKYPNLPAQVKKNPHV